jgi:hypothetical protein
MITYDERKTRKVKFNKSKVRVIYWSNCSTINYLEHASYPWRRGASVSDVPNDFLLLPFGTSFRCLQFSLLFSLSLHFFMTFFTPFFFFLNQIKRKKSATKKTTRTL